MKVLSSILLSCFLLLPEFGWGQAPRSFDLQAYRTSVSPGNPEDDLLLVQRIVPALARVAYPVMGGRDSSDFQAIDIDIKKRPFLRPDARIGSRTDAEVTYSFIVTGTIYQMVTEQFLSWRKSYEEQWIAAASDEASLLKTPIQMIAEDPALSFPQKVQQIIGVMNRREYQYVPPPTPNPKYWPVSDIIPLRDAGVSLQFNPRGGKVVVLEDSTGKTHILPFDPWDNPEDWLLDFERWVAGYGIESSSEFARKRAASAAGKPASLEDYLAAQHQSALKSRSESTTTGPPNPGDSVAVPAPLEPLIPSPDTEQ